MDFRNLWVMNKQFLYSSAITAILIAILLTIVQVSRETIAAIGTAYAIRRMDTGWYRHYLRGTAQL